MGRSRADKIEQFAKTMGRYNETRMGKLVVLRMRAESEVRRATCP